jgi:hypothetical protein
VYAAVFQQLRTLRTLLARRMAKFALQVDF